MLSSCAPHTAFQFRSLKLHFPVGLKTWTPLHLSHSPSGALANATNTFLVTTCRLSTLKNYPIEDEVRSCLSLLRKSLVTLKGARVLTAPLHLSLTFSLSLSPQSRDINLPPASGSLRFLFLRAGTPLPDSLLSSLFSCFWTLLKSHQIRTTFCDYPT